ncbi:MAG: hypothetical protein M2R46_04349 [Verrucomicrobia subdivision 3 bacterium]|nr:hypothetical protein [Limisphaerales bacterium]
MPLDRMEIRGVLPVIGVRAQPVMSWEGKRRLMFLLRFSPMTDGT